MTWTRLLAVPATLLAAAALAAPAAGASHPLIATISGFLTPPPPPVSEEHFSDACGVAVDSRGDVYVSDYYRDRVIVLGPEREYLTRIDGIEPLTSSGAKAVNGPCQLAVGPAGDLYVESYHGAVRRFRPASYPPGEGTSYGAPETIDAGPSTGIAVDPASGDLYVDDRTYVARYEAPIAAGAEPAQKIGEGTLGDGYGVALSGFAGDAQYASTAGDLYVADAGSETVKAYDPSVSATVPVAEIDGEGTAEGSLHLADADLAVDSGDGHLYVSDALEPHFEEAPELVVDEFSPAGFYRGSVPPSFLNGFPSFLTDAEPSALAIAPGGLYAGDLFVTSGNWEHSLVYVFGPAADVAARRLRVAKAGAGRGTVTSIPAAILCGATCEGEFDEGSTVVLREAAAEGSVFAGWSGCDSETDAGGCAVTMGEDREAGARFEPAPAAAALAATGSGGGASAPAAPTEASTAGAPAKHGAGATLVRSGDLQMALSGGISPSALPRRGSAPVAVSVGGRISTVDGSQLPQLKRITIEFNRHGRLEDRGLPACPLARIRIASSARALSACRAALVGRGRFEGDIVLRGQEPYPTTGQLLVFNGRRHGRPVLYGHIYSSKPFATSFVIEFDIRHRAHGRFGTVLTASLPEALGDWGYVTAIRMRLFRRYAYGGRSRSYLSAGCPAPKGFPGALFTLARTRFSFAGGKTLTATMTRSCRVR